MTKRIIKTILVTFLLCCMLQLPVCAASGECGEDVTWELSDDGTLTISGSGPMTDYKWMMGPWKYNSAVKKVVVKDGVTSVGSNSFMNCSKLNTIILADSVTRIGQDAFEDCSSLTDITFSKNLARIENSAFYGCKALTSVQIPDSVTYLGNYAFFKNDKLTTVKIPKGVKEIGHGVFAESPNMTEILVDSNNAYFKSVDGVLYSKNGKTLFCFPNGKAGSYNIPDGVTEILDEAFRTRPESTKLTKLTLPESVNTIGFYGFAGCAALEEVNIPKGVTVIKHGTFSGCDGLTSIVLPEGLTTIEESAFIGCDNLVNVTIPDSVTSIEHYAFSGCRSLESITIPMGVTTIMRYTFQNCISLTSVVIPDGVTAIEKEVFNGCTSLESVTIPDGVTSIGTDVFKDCTNLKEICYNGTEEQWKTLIADTGNDNVASVHMRCSDSVYTIYFNSNGGSGEMTSKTVKEGEKLTLPDNGFTAPEGKRFKCWGIGSADNSAVINAGIAYTFTANTNVYAVWEDIPKEPSPENEQTGGTSSGDDATVKKPENDNSQTDNVQTHPSKEEDLTKPSVVPHAKNMMMPARISKVTATSATLKWNKVNGADGYYVYGGLCKGKQEKLATVKKTSCKVTKRKKNKWYQYCIIAYKLIDGKEAVIGQSLDLYACNVGSASKYANPSKVTVQKKTIQLKVNKSAKLKADVKLPMGKKYKKYAAKLRYIVSDEEVVSVDKKGKLTAKKKGNCVVYVCAQNGIYKTVKITVK